MTDRLRRRLDRLEAATPADGVPLALRVGAYLAAHDPARVLEFAERVQVLADRHAHELTDQPWEGHIWRALLAELDREGLDEAWDMAMQATDAFWTARLAIHGPRDLHAQADSCRWRAGNLREAAGDTLNRSRHGPPDMWAPGVAEVAEYRDPLLSADELRTEAAALDARADQLEARAREASGPARV